MSAPAPGREEDPGLRLERLLPYAIFAAAALLFASELMTMFEFTPPGAEPLADQSAIDRHHYAQIILAIFAVISMLIAIGGGSKPWASAVAVCGIIALLIFLIGDLPDANAIGTLDDPRQNLFEAEAVPQGGFWLELVGALGLAVSGAALATLTGEQIAALGPGGGRQPKERPAPRDRPRRRSGRAKAPSAEGDTPAEAPARAESKGSSGLPGRGQ